MLYVALLNACADKVTDKYQVLRTGYEVLGTTTAVCVLVPIIKNIPVYQVLYIIRTYSYEHRVVKITTTSRITIFYWFVRNEDEVDCKIKAPEDLCEWTRKLMLAIFYLRERWISYAIL